MTVPRFYAPDVSRPQERIRLTDDEAAHLTRVLRLRVGAHIRVFDGRGHEFAAQVESVDRNGVVVQTLEAVGSAHEPATSLTLAQSVLKGRAFDGVVKDASMLGVVNIQPLVTARMDVPDDTARGEALHGRWQRVAVASTKQSGRAVVPVLRPVITLSDHLSGCHDERHLVLVEPSIGLPQTDAREILRGSAPTTATVTIGPEGGWTSTELEMARAQGCQLVTLGGRTLRADAAPLVAVSILLYLWGDL